MTIDSADIGPSGAVDEVPGRRSPAMTGAHAMTGAAADASSWWTTTWPIGRHEWTRLGAALAAVVAVGVVVGELLTNWSVLSGLVDTDQRIAEDLAAGRTETTNNVAHWGAFIADTPVKIAISILIAGFLLWRFKRWHETVLIGLPLIFEATAFIIITFIVQRPRPDVERLLDSPVNSSFPSGHVAAATVYAAIVIVVFSHTRAVWARGLAVAVAVAAPVIVAWARMYQGMHFLTDVIAGMVLGVASIAICRWVLGPLPEPAAAIARVDERARVVERVGADS